MKWSRVIKVPWEGYDQKEGDDVASLLQDVLDREDHEGALERLQQQVEILQAVLGRVLEDMEPQAIQEIIEDATYRSDYWIKA